MKCSQKQPVDYEVLIWIDCCFQPSLLKRHYITWPPKKKPKQHTQKITAYTHIIRLKVYCK